MSKAGAVAAGCGKQSPGCGRQVGCARRMARVGGRCGLVALCLALVLCLAAEAVAAGEVAQRRAEVYNAAARGAEGIAQLERALADESPLVRRAAVRALVRLGAPAREALTGALENADPVVRRAALAAIAGAPDHTALPHLARALSDEDASVRETTVRLLVAVAPRTDAVEDLLRQAATDRAPEVQVTATVALAAARAEGAAFRPPPTDRVLLRDRPDMADHVSRITIAQAIPLPRDGWKFRVDPAHEGHQQGWFEPDFDDAAWSDASIETPWMAGYVGVGWYRRAIDLPERPEHLAAELLFESVDENAWVWVNGVYVGGQDIGPAGWNQAFRLDVTEELKWGARNQITVRVRNTTAAGGIWKPVTLQVLTLR